MAQISSTKCNICKKELGELFCYECQHFLCTSCKLFHEKFPATKRHSVTESYNIDRTTLSSHQLCDAHKLDFVHYCLTCELLTCSACVTSTHKGHSFTEVSEITAKARTLVTEDVAMLKEKLKTLSALIDRTKSKEIDFIKKESDKFISNVNTISDDFIGIVNSVTEINITRVSDYHVTEKQGLEYSVAKLEKTYSEYQTLCTKLEQLLLQKHHVEFFNIHQSLTKELKELDDIPNIEEPLSIEQFKENDFTDLVIEKIQNKYEICFKLEIQRLKDSLRQEEGKFIALEKRKDAELVKVRQEIKRLKSEVKQNIRSLHSKDNTIKILKQSLTQEKVKRTELQKAKDAELVKFHQKMERLETEVKQRTENLNLKEKEKQQLKDSLGQEKEKLILLQRTKDAESLQLRQEIEKHKTEGRHSADLIIKDKEIQDLTQSLAQEKAKAMEPQKKKDAEFDKLGKKIEGPETEVKKTTEVDKKKQPKLYLAIHLGDTHSDYCYSLRCDKCGKIKSHTIIGTVPTSSLLNERTIDVSSIQEVSVTDDGKKQLPALTLCSMTVKFLLDHATQTGLRYRFGIDNDLLQDTVLHSSKILIVPDRLTKFGKEFMLNAAKQAGIDDKELMIVTESEAAFANVQHNRADICNTKYFEHGSSFILVNCGDSTLDITVNQIKDQSSLKQIFNKHVNNSGLILVKEGFIKLMSDVFGKAIYAKWCSEFRQDSLDLYRDLDIKRSFNWLSSEDITIKLPCSFNYLLENETGLDTKSFISQSNYSGELKTVADKIRIKASFFRRIWNDAINNITLQMQSVVDVYNSLKINEIIIIGSFFEPPVVETLQKSFSDIDFYVSKQAHFSALFKGEFECLK